jgi:Putative Ig domain
MLTGTAIALRRGALPRLLILLAMTLVAGSCSNVGSSGSTTPLAVTTQALPNGQVGTAYSATLAATGGTVPYTWALTSGSLPAGLALNATTGEISGTPTASVTAAALSFSVTDSGAHTSSVNLALTVDAFGLKVTTSFLPDGQIGAPYSTTLTAAGGTPPYTWALTSGSLPAGLALAAATGVISGTPTASTSATPLSFSVTDSSNPAVSATVSLTLTIAAVPLVITTTALPDGQTGVPYSATLSSTGGTGAVTWVLTAGPLPVGLALNATTGVISGTPTIAAFDAPLTFRATDSGTPAQVQSAAFSVTINPSGTTVDVLPRRAALTVTQTMSVAATTNDAAGVTWSVSPAGGSFTPAASLNGANVTFTAPATAGMYTITATSVSDTARTAAITVGVTDLAGVYTYHNDLARTGVNAREFALTTATVNSNSFGKLFSCTVDGAVYAQPLWVANLTVAGTRHNVVFVATAHDSLYAFDADTGPCLPLWQVSLIDATHGGSATETTVPSGATGNLVGLGYGDIAPEVGVIGSPVIDAATNTLYVVSKSVDASKTVFHQRLHAIDLATGSEKSSGSPVNIAATYPINGGSTVSFSARQQNQRAALTLSGGTVWVAWGSHEDSAPWYGWLIGYTYSGGAFAQSSVLNVAPNASESGIWMSGGAPSVDSSGSLYLITGNGAFDATSTTAPNNDYGDSFLQLKPGTGSLAVSSYFTPTDQADDDNLDQDFGSGGAALVLNLGTGSPSHLVLGGGKDGALYILNGDSLGGSGDAHAYQVIHMNAGIFATGAFWNNTLYLAPLGLPMMAYTFDPVARKFNTTVAAQSSNPFQFPGATASISANGASSNGLVWGINSHNYCTPQSGGCGPAQLYAYSATGLGTPLWSSTALGADTAGNAVKFIVPTVANGRVYVGTRGDNRGGGTGSTSKDGELDVYGLKPN